MIEINNTTNFAVDKKLFTGLAKIIIKGENKQIDLSVAFISRDEIKKANKKYRNMHDF
jgi:ssRNA-specific RNase YbeY (16S rRNA maturation enzyme)